MATEYVSHEDLLKAYLKWRKEGPLALPEGSEEELREHLGPSNLRMLKVASEHSESELRMALVFRTVYDTQKRAETREQQKEIKIGR